MTDDDVILLAHEAGFPVVRMLSGRIEIGGHSLSRFRRLIKLAVESGGKHQHKPVPTRTGKVWPC